MQPNPRPVAVNLKRKIKLGNTWTFVPVARKNDRYLPDQVLIAGVATKVTEGTFYVEWREDGKRIQRAVGSNGHEAISAYRTQTKIHSLRSEGVRVDDAPQVSAGRKTIAEEVEQYLHDTRAKHRPKTLAKYQEALDSFVKVTKKQHLEDPRAQDIREFLAYMTLEEELMPRTVKVKGRIVHGVFTSLGASLQMKKGDWPKVTKKSSRPMYRTDTIKRLLATVRREHYIIYSFFLHTGFREQEVAFCSWDDVNWERGEISVKEKPHLGFEIKNYERRTVPVVEELMDLLREQRQTLPEDAYLIFPTKAQSRDCALKSSPVPTFKVGSKLSSRPSLLVFRKHAHGIQAPASWFQSPSDKPMYMSSPSSITKTKLPSTRSIWISGTSTSYQPRS